MNIPISREPMVWMTGESRVKGQGERANILMCCQQFGREAWNGRSRERRGEV
jgi:hypothetical protein